MKWSSEKLKEAYETSFKARELPFVKCSRCGTAFYYPRVTCINCGSGELELLKSKGKGRILSYTWGKDREGRKFVYAIVEMDEGFRLYGNVEGEVGFDFKVKVDFEDRSGRILPFFKTVSG